MLEVEKQNALDRSRASARCSFGYSGWTVYRSLSMSVIFLFRSDWVIIGGSLCRA